MLKLNYLRKWKYVKMGEINNNITIGMLEILLFQL